MSQHNRETGQWGEEMAREYLSKKGYEILHTNWRFSYAEVDIICKHKGMIVFVEVKARQGNFTGNPEDDVHADKQKQMVFAAEAYADKFNVMGELRFDVVAITLINGKSHIVHIEDAFYPYA